jgi:hypothetical protein
VCSPRVSRAQTESTRSASPLTKIHSALLIVIASGPQASEARSVRAKYLQGLGRAQQLRVAARRGGTYELSREHIRDTQTTAFGHGGGQRLRSHVLKLVLACLA